MNRTAIVLGAILAAASCDLRPVTQDLAGRSVALRTTNAERLAAELRIQMLERGATLVNPTEDPDLIIELRDETFKRQLLSVLSESGKTAEYELEYSVYLATNGKEYPIQVVQDIAHGEEPALAKRSEEEHLQEELLRRAADLVLLYMAPPD